MRRFVTVLITILVVLFAVFIIQNAQAVPLRFTFWSTEIPLALLMILCAAVGFLVGIFAFSIKRKNTTKPSSSTTQTPPPKSEETESTAT